MFMYGWCTKGFVLVAKAAEEIAFLATVPHSTVSGPKQPSFFAGLPRSLEVRKRM
jgi:hypothetical protein